MDHRSLVLRALGLAALPALTLMLACSGSSGSTPAGGLTANPVTPASGQVTLLVTDAPSDSWADIGVIIRGIWLVPKGAAESAAVLAYDGSKSTTQTNLVQLDNVAQLLKSATIAAGDYDRAIVKVDGAPANITLAPSLDASGNPQNAIPAAQIVVNATLDANGWATVPTITFQSDLSVSATGATAVNLDFNLSSPMFVVTHDEPGGTTFYTLNFVVKHKPQTSLDALVLHHNDGTVTAVAPTATPNTFTVHTLHDADVTYTVDSTNKTLFYNLDTTPVAANASAALPADLTVSATTPLYARVTSRLQNDGSLWAVRVWYSATQAKLPKWAPEGHVTKVDAANGFIWVLNDAGKTVKFAVNATTGFVFQGGTTPIGTGASFLANLTRGFKVMVTANALTTPATATLVDIQRAVYDGDIAAANATQFTLVKVLGGQTDTPTVGYDPTFTWWNFAFPTNSSTSVSAFVAQATATAGSVAAPIVTNAGTTLNWKGGTTNWDSVNLVFQPAPISLASQTVATAYAAGAMTIHYTAYESNGTALPNTALTVNLNTTAGSQPVVTQYTRTGNGVTVTPLTSDQWAAALTKGAKVRVFGIPNATQTLDAYVINIFN